LDGCIVSSILDNADKMPKYFLKRFQWKQQTYHIINL
jgi:hypothetical protein